MRMPLGCLWVGGAYRTISPLLCTLGGLPFFSVQQFVATQILLLCSQEHCLRALNHPIHCNSSMRGTWHHIGTIPQQSDTHNRRLGVTAFWFPIKGKACIGHKKFTEVYPCSKCFNPTLITSLHIKQRKSCNESM